MLKKHGIIAVCAAELLLVYVITHFFLSPCTVIPSGSMEPTIKAGSITMVQKSNFEGRYQRRDIVVFPDPDTQSMLYCKRIIGLPGEEIEIRQGITYVNGIELEEPYIAGSYDGSFGPYVIPENCYFLMGDNRTRSYDSRYWNQPFVLEDDIRGKVCVIWFSEGFCWKTL